MPFVLHDETAYTLRLIQALMYAIISAIAQTTGKKTRLDTALSLVGANGTKPRGATSVYQTLLHSNYSRKL